MSRRCLGGVSEVSWKGLGGVLEVSWRCLGGVSEVSRRPPSVPPPPSPPPTAGRVQRAKLILSREGLVSATATSISPSAVLHARAQLKTCSKWYLRGRSGQEACGRQAGTRRLVGTCGSGAGVGAHQARSIVCSMVGVPPTASAWPASSPKKQEALRMMRYRREPGLPPPHSSIRRSMAFKTSARSRSCSLLHSEEGGCGVWRLVRG